MTEETKKYYEEKLQVISTIFNKKIYEKEDDYEPFFNTPYSSSMIQLTHEYELSIPNLEPIVILEHLVDTTLNTLVTTSIQKITPTIELDLNLSKHRTSTSAIILKEQINNYIDIKYDSPIQKELESYKYLFFGDNNLSVITKLLDAYPPSMCEMFFGLYRNIKLYFIPNLEHIYMSNNPILSLNTIQLHYNECSKYDGSNTNMESLPNFEKKGIISSNCLLGDITLLKIKCNYTNGTAFLRKLKLDRILF